MAAPKPASSPSLQNVYMDHLHRVWCERNPPDAGASVSANSGEPIAPPAGASGWLPLSVKPGPAEFQHPSQRLVDLVRICTAARRRARGDLV